MTLQGYNAIRVETIHPLVLVTHNRFTGGREQCTVAGEAVYGIAPEDIAAGADGAVVVEGSAEVTTGAPIPLTEGTGGNQYASVQTDANGMAIPWAGAGQNVAGIIRVARAAANELACVELAVKPAPLVP